MFNDILSFNENKKLKFQSEIVVSEKNITNLPPFDT